MSKLKPGETRILKVLLEKGKLINADIKDETGLSNRAISTYLNTLQVKGFIERDIETKKDKKGKEITRITRKYKINPISCVSLMFNDMIDFMEEYLEKTINEDLKKGVSLLRLPAAVALGWIVMTDHPVLRGIISEELNKDIQTQIQLINISSKIDDFWGSYLLDGEEPKQRKIIEKYRNYLLEIVKIVNLYFSKEYQSKNKKVYEDYKKIEKEKLEQSYPGVEIPEMMIQINAKKRTKQDKRIDHQFWQPQTINHLIKSMEILEKIKLLRDESDLTPEENKRLEELTDFLLKHRKYYESFVSRINNCPKTLLIYPSWGFTGYLKEFREIAQELS